MSSKSPGKSMFIWKFKTDILLGVKKSYLNNNFYLHNNIVSDLIICTIQDLYQMGRGGMGGWSQEKSGKDLGVDVHGTRRSTKVLQDRLRKGEGKG